MTISSDRLRSPSVWPLDQCRTRTIYLDWRSVSVNSLHLLYDTHDIKSTLLCIPERMLIQSDGEFSRFIGSSEQRLRSSTGSDETTFQFQPAKDSIGEALERFANLFKSPLNRRNVVSTVRDQVEWAHESKKWNYCDESSLPLLGHVDHPSHYFPFIQTDLSATDDDTLYRRVEEFITRHYSAHRMSLCIRTHLPLNAMKVRSRHLNNSSIHKAVDSCQNEFFTTFRNWLWSTFPPCQAINGRQWRWRHSPMKMHFKRIFTRKCISPSQWRARQRLCWHGVCQAKHR